MQAISGDSQKTIEYSDNSETEIEYNVIDSRQSEQPITTGNSSQEIVEDYQSLTQPKLITRKGTIRSRIGMRRAGEEAKILQDGSLSIEKKDYIIPTIPESKDNKFIALFRGIQFNHEYFNKEDRANLSLLLKPSADINGRTQYSPACFRKAGFTDKTLLGSYLSGRMSPDDVEKLESAKKLTDAFIEFLYEKTDLKAKYNDKYFYESLLFALVNINTNIYSKMDDVLLDLKWYLTEQKERLQLSNDEIEIITDSYMEFENNESVFHRGLFISTSMREEVATRYALAKVVTEKVGKVDRKSLIGFDPEYNEFGKPKHRHGGIIEIILIPANDYMEKIQKTGKIRLNCKF